MGSDTSIGKAKILLVDDDQDFLEIYWEILKWASEHGHRKYHLGRSSADSGAEAFKKKWNAYAMQLYWHYVLKPGQPLPQLNVKNPKYQLAIQVWRELPVRLTQTIGPMVARCIP